MSRHTRQIFEFSQFRLDVERTRLTRDGELVSLPPKAVMLLTTLLKHQGRAVEKEELMETIWPNMVVEDSNLTQTIHILRKALSKYSDTNITIETLPRFGYRLIADVHECRNEGDETLPATNSPVTFKPQVIEDNLKMSQPGNGFFNTLQRYIFLWLQKRLVKFGVEEM